MPASLGILQRNIIGILILRNLRFQGNIFPHLVPCTVQQQRCKQPGHSAIAVQKRVNAEKVVDEHRDNQQCIHLSLPNGAIVRLADFAHGIRGFVGSQRCEQRKPVSCGIRCADIILHILKAAAKGRIGVAEQDFMKLQNVVWCQGNIIEIFMHNVQRIPVTGNFPLVAVARGCLLLHQLVQTGFRCADALNRVGCLSALHLGNLHQPFQFLGLLPDIHGLLPLVLMNQRQIVNDFIVPCFVNKACIIKVAHLVTSQRFLVKFTHFDEKNQG